MRNGVRLGIDVGTVRVGVSRSDPSGLLASPYCTVARREDGSDVADIATRARDLDVHEIIVGLPRSLSGRTTASTEDAYRFAHALAELVTIPIRMVDERLSTVSASRALRVNGKNARSARPLIDQTAATVILQHALESERLSGRPPGELLDEQGER